MAVCTFFGHKECPEEIKPLIQNRIEDLIQEHCVDTFYVGNEGQFDTYVHIILKKLERKYPHIHYAVVLAYLPGHTDLTIDQEDTMLPEGIKMIHPRYAISWRNNWMLRQSDYVVAYITHSWGGAAQYAAKANRKGLVVYNLASVYP